MDVEGIILRITPFKEKDAMVNIATAQGLKSFYARGVLKESSKNHYLISSFTLGLYTLNEGRAGGLSLKEGSLIFSINRAFSSPSALKTLSFIQEITLRVLTEEDVKKIYPYLKETLLQLENGFDPLTLITIYFAQALKACGDGLRVDACVMCESKKGIAGISFANGGFICKNCLTADDYVCSPLELKTYRYIFIVGYKDLSRTVLNPEVCNKIIGQLAIYCEDAAGTKLKSLELIK